MLRNYAVFYEDPDLGLVCDELNLDLDFREWSGRDLVLLFDAPDGSRTVGMVDLGGVSEEDPSVPWRPGPGVTVT